MTKKHKFKPRYMKAASRIPEKPTSRSSAGTSGLSLEEQNAIVHLKKDISFLQEVVLEFMPRFLEEHSISDYTAKLETHLSRNFLLKGAVMINEYNMDEIVSLPEGDK